MPVPLRAPILLLAALALAPALPAVASPPAAVPVQARPEDGAGPQPLADLQTLLKALEGWMKRFPTYSAPEILPNGDILIRRHPPEPPPRKPDPHPGGPHPGGTET